MKLKMRTNILVTAAAVALVMMMPVTGMAGETIKLGVVGAHSGELAPYGLPTVNAAKLVVDELNAKGGVNGKKIELLIEDDMCKPAVAARIATRLVSQGVDVVLGHTCSGATKAALPIYKAAGIILISPSATRPALTQSGEYPNFFRTIASGDMPAKAEVDYVFNVLGARKIAVIHDKGEYGKRLAEFTKGCIERSGKGKVALFEGVTPGVAVDYSVIVQKIKQSLADAVIFDGSYPEALKIVSMLREKKIDAVFLSDDGVIDDTDIKVAGKEAEGVSATGPRRPIYKFSCWTAGKDAEEVYATCPQDNSENPVSLAAIAAHKKAYNSDPGAFYENAYSAVLAILNAIEKADSTEIAAVAKALQTEKVATPVGNIHFDEKGDAVAIGFDAVYQLKNGQYVEVK